jgi:hypothetical protein
MKYSISAILFITSSVAMAQPAADTLEVDYMPTGVRIGIDAVALGYTFSDDQINSQLVVADIDFYRYFLVAELGRYERTREGANNTYTTKGSYWRIGAEMNFFHGDPDNSVLSLGIRYGASYFNDKLITSIDDPVFGTRPEPLENNNVRADWYELVAGLKVPVWKFWLGYNARLKFGIDAFNDLQFRPYEIPGYGLGAEKDYWEFNYFLMYRIEWGD